MKAFDYLRSQNLAETMQWLSESQDGEVKALAGGTDLLTLLKAGVAAPIRLIDITHSGLIPKGISESAGGVTLGALTTLTELETSPLLAARYPLVSQAAGTVLANDELLLSVRLPSLPADTRSLYLKAMDRKVWAFALVGVAAVLRLAGEKIADARLVLSGVAPIPWRLRDVEAQLMGAVAEPATLAQAAQAALAAAKPLAHNGYKVLLAERLIERALLQCAT